MTRKQIIRIHDGAVKAAQLYVLAMTLEHGKSRRRLYDALDSMYRKIHDSNMRRYDKTIILRVLDHYIELLDRKLNPRDYLPDFA